MIALAPPTPAEPILIVELDSTAERADVLEPLAALLVDAYRRRQQQAVGAVENLVEIVAHQDQGGPADEA
jgi:hypothetical protein